MEHVACYACIIHKQQLHKHKVFPSVSTLLRHSVIWETSYRHKRYIRLCCDVCESLMWGGCIHVFTHSASKRFTTVCVGLNLIHIYSDLYYRLLQYEDIDENLYLVVIQDLFLCKNVHLPIAANVESPLRCHVQHAQTFPGNDQADSQRWTVQPLSSRFN